VKSIFTGFFVLILLFVIPTNVKTQDIQVSSRSEHIQVDSDTSYTVNVTVMLKASSVPVVYPIFYDHELEQVYDLEVHRIKRNRFRTFNDPVITEETIDLDHITSKKVKYIFIPADTETKITYKISCNELMYFADLRFFSFFQTDTIRYRVSIPEMFSFSYIATHTDLLDYLTIDSLKTDNFYEWNIELTPVKVEPDPLMYFGIYRNRKLPILRTVVVPKAFKNNEESYLNNWFLGKSESVKALDTAAKEKIDELTLGLTDSTMILEAIYNFVKSNFKYVSIQIGMGAFIPSHVNEVFINKQGDCKDLSNFLCEALNYKGIESYLALAATYDHISDCDFPSLGSANHVVCVAYIDGNPVILDPTDPIHIPNKPVQSIQGSTILIINPDGGEYHEVETFSPQQNGISYEIELAAYSDESLLEGGFKVRYEGISGNFLKRTILDLSDDKIDRLTNQHYKLVFNHQSVNEIRFLNHQDSITAEGDLSVKGKIFHDENNQILFIDFLPGLIESKQRETLLDGTFIGNTISKNVKLQITMDRKFEPFDPVSHVFSENGASLSLKISNPSDYIIKYEYDFILDHILMDGENTEIVNQILNAFKRISNEPIILKSKS
jgi:hypothetical protein